MIHTNGMVHKAMGDSHVVFGRGGRCEEICLIKPREQFFRTGSVNVFSVQILEQFFLVFSGHSCHLLFLRFEIVCFDYSDGALIQHIENLIGVVDIDEIIDFDESFINAVLI